MPGELFLSLYLPTIKKAYCYREQQLHLVQLGGRHDL